MWAGTSSPNASNTGCSFFFRLQLRDWEKQKATPVLPVTRDIEERLQYLDNIKHNVQEGYAVLKVEAKKYANLGSEYLGWSLSEVSFRLGTDLSSHKLRLTFQVPITLLNLSFRQRFCLIRRENIISSGQELNPSENRHVRT